MKSRMIFSATLWTSLLLCGCVTKYQHEVDRALLVQENQKLEDALYVTHSQLVDTVKENESLKTRLGENGGSSGLLGKARRPAASRSDSDLMKDFVPPQIIIPDENGGSEQFPESLRTAPGSGSSPSGRVVPPPSPSRRPETLHSAPVLIDEEQQISLPALPDWNPKR